MLPGIGYECPNNTATLGQNEDSDARMAGQNEESNNIALGQQSLTPSSSTQYVHSIRNEGLTPKSKFSILGHKWGEKKTFTLAIDHEPH